MIRVRPIREVRVWSRSHHNARLFAERESARHGIPVEVAPDVAAAATRADIICATTASTEPVLPGSVLQEGMHVNTVGAFTPSSRELDTAAVARSRLFVDRRESAENEAGDYLVPLREGAIDEGHILAEIGEILIGRHPGRQNPAEITVFKSLGLAVEDVAAAHHVYRRALETGSGTRVKFGAARREQ